VKIAGWPVNQMKIVERIPRAGIPGPQSHYASESARGMKGVDSASLPPHGTPETTPP
jgi:hypothetical protein